MSVGLAAPAFAQEKVEDDGQVKVDILGDSYNSGEGMRDTYFDPEDRRHRSPFASNAQALERLQNANPDVDIDAQIGASSGAVTRDIFEPQVDVDGNVVNPPQGSLVRPDADAVIMGFGGNDARFADLLTEAWHSVTSGQSSPDFDQFMQDLGPLLNNTLTPEEYQKQTASTPGGQAPTIVARMLQAMKEIQAKAPNAELVVPNYPIPVDPEATSFWSRFSEYELQRFRVFGTQLNQAIAKAVEICGCATLADNAGALDGREVYTDDPALNDLNAALTGRHDRWNTMEPFHPNVEGGGLMADAVARALAEALGMKPPEEGGARPTPFHELREAPDPKGFEPLTRGQRDEEESPNTDDETSNGKDAEEGTKDDGKGSDEPGKGTEEPGTGDPVTEDPGTTDPGERPDTTDPGTSDPGTEKPGTSDPGKTDPATDIPPPASENPVPTPISSSPEPPPIVGPTTSPHEGGDGDGGDPAPPADTTPPADSAPPADSGDGNDDGNTVGGGSDAETPANSSGSPDDRDGSSGEGSDSDAPANSPGSPDDRDSRDSPGIGLGGSDSETPANSSGSPDDRDGSSGDSFGGDSGGSHDSSPGSDSEAPANSSGSPDDRDGSSGDSFGGDSGGSHDASSGSGSDAPANSSGSPDDRDADTDTGGGFGSDTGGWGGDDSADSGADTSNNDTDAPSNSSGSPDDRDGTSGDTPGGGYADSYGDGDASCACW